MPPKKQLNILTFVLKRVKHYLRYHYNPACTHICYSPCIMSMVMDPVSQKISLNKDQSTFMLKSMEYYTIKYVMKAACDDTSIPSIFVYFKLKAGT